jgi:competence protein ComEC
LVLAFISSLLFSKEIMKNTPFIKLLLPLVLGIIVGKNYFISKWPFPLIFLAISFILFILYHNLKYSSYRLIIIKSLFLFTHVFCWGLFISKYYNPSETKAINNKDPKIYQLSSQWVKSKSNYKAKAFLLSSKHFYASSETIIVLKSNSVPNGFPGDFLLTKRNSNGIKPSLNPMQFDYKAYLELQGISNSLYLENDNYIFISNHNLFSPIRFFAKIKKNLLALLDSFPLNASSRAFIKALVFGDKSELDSDISTAFASAGAMHVLAVSGLHVGIIVSIFSRLLSLLKINPNNKGYRWFKTLVLLLVIWLFAGITGFSPSIVRAAIMFSFLSIGQSLIQHSNIYNSLAMAAFFMLLLNPTNLFSVGFQLSFLAVLSIVFFYDKIYRSLYFKFKPLRYVWSITAVSISAQLATFPLALFYFHQFPLYFILSNLLVIPAAFATLLLSLTLLALGHFSLAVLVLSRILNSLVDLLNYLIIVIEKLPFSSIRDIYINKTILLLCFFSIIGFSIYSLSKRKASLYITLCFINFIFLTRLHHKMVNHTKQQLVFYSISNHLLIDLISNTDHVLIGDSLIWRNEKKIKYAIENYLRFKGLKQLEKTVHKSIGIDSLDIQKNYILSKNHLLLNGSIVCFNHSSHKSTAINRIDHRFVFTSVKPSYLKKHPIIYEKILTNYPSKSSYNKNNEIKVDKLSHSMSIQGYFSRTIRK